MSDELRVSLNNLAKGGLEEIFDYELTRVLANILDPNTTEKAREINVKVKIKPNKERDFCDVQIDCTSKLSPVAAIATHLYVGKTSGGIRAIEHNPEQMKLGLGSEKKAIPDDPKVISINKGGE